MKRLMFSQLLELGATLPEPERQLIGIVEKLGLVTHRQAATLLTTETSTTAARGVRRTLKRLTEAGLLVRLNRRIGGVRAGSSGYVYGLGPAGQRLIAYWDGQGLVRGRFRPEPGGRYVRHRLAVSDVYVQLVRAERGGLLDLLTFDAEPNCWRRLGDGFGGSRTLKPDAFVRIGLGAYEDRYFVEVDLASESRRVIADKVRAYLDYFRSGHEQATHGVFPRVLLLTLTEERRAALVETCSRLPAEAWQLFTIARLDQAVAIFSSEQGRAQVDELEALS